MSLPYGFRHKFAKYEIGALPSKSGHVLIVLKEGSVYVPGDERSRTHPGHGYPAHSVSYRDATIFFFGEDEGTWQEAALDLYREDQHRKDVWAFRASLPLRPEVSVKLTQ